MSGGTWRRVVLAGVLGLGAVGLVAGWPDGGAVPERGGEAVVEEVAVGEGSVTMGSRVAVRGRGRHGIEVEVAAVDSTAVDAKQRLFEQQRLPEADEVLDLGLDGPRPAPAVEVRQTHSRAELELPPELERQQARRLGDALTQRAAVVRELAEAARAEGDEPEAVRQERILARLEVRTVALAEHAAAIEAEDPLDEQVP